MTQPIRHLIIIGIILLGSIIINGILQAARTAFMSLDKKKMEEKREQGEAQAYFILKIINNSKTFVTTMDYLEKFNHLITASITSYLLMESIWPLYLERVPQILGLFLIFLLYAILLLAFGQLIPKTKVLYHNYKFAKKWSLPIRFLLVLAKPFVFLSTKISNMMLNGMHLKQIEQVSHISRDEILSTIEFAHNQKVLTDNEKEMMISVLELESKESDDIMTARTEVFAININEPLENYIKEMVELRYSRIPIFEDHIDNIIGLLYVKDFLLEAYRYGFDKVDLKRIVKPAYFVPESKKVHDLFLELKQKRKHMAILIDEYGGFSGIVTIEDIVEEITGDIDDEHDLDVPDIRRVDDKTFYAFGSLSIKELNSHLGSSFDEDSEDYDTLGGLLIDKLGYVPEDGQKKTLTIGNVSFYIDLIWDNRIQRVRVHLLEEEEIEHQEEEKEEE